MAFRDPMTTMALLHWLARRGKFWTNLYRPPMPGDINKPSGAYNPGAYQDRGRHQPSGQYNKGAFEEREVFRPTGAYNKGAFTDEGRLSDLDPYGTHYFTLEIDDLEVARFMECSGIKSSAEVFEIEEGGLNTHSHKRTGMSKWENITLKVGLGAGHRFAEWRDAYLSTPAGGYEKRPTTTGSIVMRNNAGEELQRYDFYEVWPVSWEGPSFSSGGSDLAIETLEVAHSGIVLKKNDSPTTPGQSGDTSGGMGPVGSDIEVPFFLVGVFGMDLTQDDRVIEMIVEDHADMMGAVRVTIDATGFEWSKIKLGDPMTISFGGASEVLFGGFVTGWRHYRSDSGQEFVEIQGRCPLVKLARSRNTRVYEEQTDSDIVSNVLSSLAGTVDSTSGARKYVMQRSESDLTFLRRLAARNGYLLKGTIEGKVDFVKPQYTGSEILLERRNMIYFEYLISHNEIPTGVTVYGWDYVAKEVVEGTAGSGDIDEIGMGTNAVSAAGTIWQDALVIRDQHIDDQATAKACAVAELNRLARTLVKGRGVVGGNGAIRAGARVRFAGWANGFNPDAWVTGSKHIMSQGRYRTEFFFVSNTQPE